VAEHLWTCWERSPSRYTAKRIAAEQFGLVSFQGGSAAVWACNPSLRGALTGGKRDRHGGYPSVKEGAFEPLISPQRHLQAVAAFLRERATNSPRRASHATPLSGKVVCGCCGYRMQLHRLLSRPGTAWTFRCRREGCSQHDRRIKYELLLERCRLHLLQRQDQLLAAMAGLLSKPTVDPDLERKLHEQQGIVSDLLAMVARRPSANLQRELEAAESELADLQLAASTKPEAFDSAKAMAYLAPLFSGELEAEDLGNGAIDIHYTFPTNPDPANFVKSLLQPQPFKDNAALIIKTTIHSLVVKAIEGTIEVRD
jgi:hypothetical protein